MRQASSQVGAEEGREIVVARSNPDSRECHWIMKNGILYTHMKLGVGYYK